MIPTPGRILVIQTAWLGDVVLTTPLFAALKRTWPRASLSVVVTPASAPLLANLPDVDGLIVHDKRRGGLKDLGRVMAAVRGGGFDLVVSPHRSARSALLAWRSGAPHRVGYVEASCARAYNIRVRRPHERHEVERILALAAAVGAKVEWDARPRLVATAEERAAARVLAGGKPYALVSPSSAWETKRWTPTGFAAAADWLAARGLAVVLTGPPGDVAVGAAVEAAMTTPAINLFGRTDIRGLVALVAEAAVVLANDSAPIHIAAAFDVPTVAVFGATVPAQGFGPRASRAEVVEVSGLECRPCGAHGGRKCPPKHFKCMSDINAAAVTAALGRVLPARLP